MIFTTKHAKSNAWVKDLQMGKSFGFEGEWQNMMIFWGLHSEIESFDML